MSNSSSFEKGEIIAVSTRPKRGVISSTPLISKCFQMLYQCLKSKKNFHEAQTRLCDMTQS